MGRLRGHEVSTLPASDEAAAPPAIAQILDEGATGPLGFVHPRTTDLSLSSATIRPEQRREHAPVRDCQLGEKDAGLVPLKRAQLRVRRMERTAARLLQGHNSLSGNELPGRGLSQFGGGSDETRAFPLLDWGARARPQADGRRQNRAHLEEKFYA
jgi:hypothetical protein